MDNNFLLVALSPFISNYEVSYYADLEFEKLTLLVSLAPFAKNSNNLMKISKLNINNLQKLTGLLPQFDADKIEEYFK